MLTHSLTNVTLRNYRHRDQNTLYQSLVLHASDLPALPSFLIPHLPLPPQQIYNSATRYCRTQPPQTPKGQWWSRPSPLNDWIKRFLTRISMAAWLTYVKFRGVKSKACVTRQGASRWPQFPSQKAATTLTMAQHLVLLQNSTPSPVNCQPILTDFTAEMNRFVSTNYV